MKIIIGLGNPGEKYEDTWHNCGFLAADALARMLGKSPADFKMQKKFNALALKTKIGKEKLIIAKPQTFMNESGRAAQAIAAYYKIGPEDIFVAFDDLDIPLGKMRVRQEGSAGGHKGAQSIINMLGTGKFPRFRIGIGVSESDPRKNIPSENFVLQKFQDKEKETVSETIEKAAGAMLFALERGIEEAMNEFN